MSHQTGIATSPKLKQEFLAAQSGSSSIRFIKTQIQDEQLVPVQTQSIKGSWEDDFSLVQASLDKTTPSYIIYRKDDGNFILLCHVPDDARVRDKMLYAATKASLTKDLGDSAFVDSCYGTTHAEFSLTGYQKHVRHQNAEAPLTFKEEELKSVKRAEVGVDISASSRKSHVSGIAFPMSDAGLKALETFTQTPSILIFAIRGEQFELELVKAVETIKHALAAIVKISEPRFIAFRASASNGSESIVFAYVCPSDAPVRLRMLYSSSRTALLSYFEERKIEITKKLEVTEFSELTSAAVETELGINVDSPVENKGFIKKTAGPGGGPRRLVKS